MTSYTLQNVTSKVEKKDKNRRKKSPKCVCNMSSFSLLMCQHFCTFLEAICYFNTKFKDFMLTIDTKNSKIKKKRRNKC